MQKIAHTYTIEDFEQLGDGLVQFVGIAKKLTSPKALDFLGRAADIPAKLDLSGAKPVGFFGAAFALRDPEVRQGMGVLLEMTKGLSLLKDSGAAEGESKVANPNNGDAPRSPGEDSAG